MNIYRKIFLAIFLVSIVLLALSVYGFYRFTLRDITNRHGAKYRAAAATMAEAISNLERTTEGHMTAALEAMRYYHDAHPIPEDEALATMAKELSVSSIELVDSRGQFIRSTSYKLADLPNLFALCSGYRDLFSGQRMSERTPLMPSLVDGRVWKYSLLASSDRQHIFNVGMEVRFIDDLFRSLFEGDRQLLGIGLFTPSGHRLGYFRRDSAGFSGEQRNGTNELGITTHRDRLEVVERVPATVSQCCECVTKGLTKEPGGGFHYILRIEVSLDELREGTQQLRILLGTLLMLGLLLSYFLARAIAQRLHARIAEINAKTDELVGLKDLGQRLKLSGADEVARIGQNFDRLLDALEGTQKELLAAEKARALGTVARQVVHDIRSPLAVLDVAMGAIHADLPEDTRSMLRSAVRRIRDIVNDLRSDKSDEAPQQDGASHLEEAATVSMLSSLVERVVSEKRIQHAAKMHVEIEAPLDAETYGIFVEVPVTAFKRALSNLIDNAVEALSGSGKVNVRVSTESSQAHIAVADNGRGIPQELLPHLGEPGFTAGKEKGSGLGLYQARSTVERSGGRLAIRSTVGAGTTVDISLPQAQPASWFLAKIEISSGMTVVVLDDDHAIHATWDRLLSAFVTQGLCVLHFSEVQQLRDWLAAHRAERLLGLIDHELLRQNATGLDVIEQEGLATRAILVTSRYEEAQVLERAAKLALKIIPKEMVGLVPIVYRQKPDGLRVLVVDDEDLIAWTWRQKRQSLGIAELCTFKSMEQCEAARLDYASFDFAFIDLKIKGTAWSIDRTIRHLKSHGVKKVIVASGLPGMEHDARCRQADGFLPEKVPDDLRRYLPNAQR